MKKKRIIVRSPALYRECSNLFHGNRHGFNWQFWFCARSIARMVELPVAKKYWVVASDEQWEDDSGVQVKLKVTGRGVKWSPNPDSTSPRGELMPLATKRARRLFPKDGLYSAFFRLEYEE